MPADPPHSPLSNAFFPASRIGLVTGLVVAFAGIAALKSYGRAPVVEADVVEAAVVDAPVVMPVEAAPVKAGARVVNVWLEGCPDCMAAFEAWRAVDESGALKMPVTNVAYGRASPEFTEKYRVGANLVVDADGSQFVRRYGIGTFTTLVLDAEGNELMRDRPDAPGFAARVNDAFAHASAAQNRN